MCLSRLFEYAGNAWLLIFAAYVLLCVVVGVVEGWRKKELWESPAISQVVILWLAWVLPFVVAAMIVGWLLKWVLLYPIIGLLIGVHWLWYRLFGKPKHQFN